MRPISALLIGAALIGLSGCATIGDWFASENVEPPAELTPLQPALEVQTLWSERVGKGTRGEFVRLPVLLAPDRVVAAAARGRVAAFDAANGKGLWETDTDVPIAGGPGGGDGLVLVGSSDGEVVALDLDSGKERWRASLTSEVLAAPRVAEGVAVVRTIDGRVVGLDATDGRRLWVFSRTVPVLSLRGTSAPLLVPGRVIVGLDSGKLVALTLKDGKPLWEATLAVPRGRSELERMVDIDADPVVSDSTVYAAAFQGRVGAVDLNTGSVRWARDISSYAGIGEDWQHVYVTDERSNVWALDKRTGASLWKQDALHDRQLTAPVAMGDAVVVGDFEGYLHWLARDDGRLLARTKLDSKGILAPPAVMDDTLYATGAGGVIAALRVSPIAAQGK